MLGVGTMAQPHPITLPTAPRPPALRSPPASSVWGGALRGHRLVADAEHSADTKVPPMRKSVQAIFWVLQQRHPGHPTIVDSNRHRSHSRCHLGASSNHESDKHIWPRERRVRGHPSPSIRSWPSVTSRHHAGGSSLVDLTGICGDTRSCELLSSRERIPSHWPLGLTPRLIEH